MKDNNLNVLIQSARQPVIDKLEKALEINRELVELLEDLCTDYEEIGGEAFYNDAYKKAKQAIAKHKETADDRE